MSELDENSKRDVRTEFHELINMAPAELRRWLETETSRSVGMTAEGEKVTSPDDGEAVGHAMGERILELKGLRQAELGEDEYRAMRKVIGYIRRHLAQRPAGDVRDSRWRHSLMNWGHDPLED